MVPLIDGNNERVALRLPKKKTKTHKKKKQGMDAEEDVGRRKGEGERIWREELREGIPRLPWRPQEKLQK